MRGPRRRPPLWLLLAVGAVALQTLSLFVATAAHYVPVYAGPCGLGFAQCLTVKLVPTYPYVGLGIILFAGGAALMGAAVVLLRRSPRRLDPRPVSA